MLSYSEGHRTAGGGHGSPANECRRRRASRSRCGPGPNWKGLSIMKTLEWQSFLAEQSAKHGKLVFSVANLRMLPQRRSMGEHRAWASDESGASFAALRTALRSDAGSRTRNTSFRRWTRRLTLRLLHALLHHLVTQGPTEVTSSPIAAITRSRPDQPAGPEICPRACTRFFQADGLGGSIREQALYDFAWLNLRDVIDSRALVTFENLGEPGPRAVEEVFATISSTSPDRSPGITEPPRTRFGRCSAIRSACVQMRGGV